MQYAERWSKAVQRTCCLFTWIQGVAAESRDVMTRGAVHRLIQRIVVD